MNQLGCDTVGHGSSRGWVRSNAHDNARRVAVVAGTGVAGEEQYDVAGGGVFRASNDNGDVARYWANGRASRALLDAASSMATRPCPFGHRRLVGDELRGAAFGRFGGN